MSGVAASFHGNVGPRHLEGDTHGIIVPSRAQGMKASIATSASDDVRNDTTASPSHESLVIHEMRGENGVGTS